MLHMHESGNFHEERCETSDQEAHRTDDREPGSDLDRDLNKSSDEKNPCP